MLTPVTEAEFADLRDLAGTIWREHYASIITPAQIEYMLAGRFNDEALRACCASPGKWLELLRVAGTLVGYCGYELAPDDPAALKLGQLYVLRSHRGHGLGRLMLTHVEARARELGRTRLLLQVNKRNAGAIGFYAAAGFTLRCGAVFDIGGGYVMDDYVLEKTVPERGITSRGRA